MKDPSTPGLVTQISFSSVDYTVDGEDAQSPDQISVISAPLASKAPPSTAPPSLPPDTTPDSVSLQETMITNNIMPSSNGVLYCCALYDYDATTSDELSFEEGQVSLQY